MRTKQPERKKGLPKKRKFTNKRKVISERKIMVIGFSVIIVLELLLNYIDKWQ